MGLRVSISLILLGAVLAFAVTAKVTGIDLQTLGLIVLLVGVGGLAVSLWRLTRLRETAVPTARTRAVRTGWAERRRRPGLPAAQRQEASRLAAEARLFLEAERYTEGRIEELAVEFVRHGVGRTRDEFVAWALAKGQYGPELPSTDSG
jgi:Domain of unknown function (DUF6458)